VNLMQCGKKMKNFKLALFFGGSILAYATSVQAQNANQNVADEIIVSAPRKTNNFLTPYSVSKLNKETLEKSGVKKAQDLIQIVPSLQFPQSESALSVTARIRGIGTQGTNVGLEPSVGIMIDGVSRSRTAAGFGDLGQLETIEIARGPQSTMYGTNVSAGLIYVITQKPTQENFIETNVGVGNLNYKSADFTINRVLNEKLSGRIFTNFAKQNGYMIVNEGLANERRDNNINYYTARGQLYYDAGQTNWRLIADYAKRNEDCCNAPVYISDSRVPVNSTLIINRINQYGKYSGNQFADLRAYADRPFEQKIFDKGLSLEINHNYDFANLKSISAIRSFDFAYAQDGEWSGADILYRDLSLHPGAIIKDFSQEFRLSGKWEKLDWLMGINYSNQEINSHNVFQYGKDYEAYIGGLLSGAAAATIPVTQYSINLRNLISSATNGNYDVSQTAMVEGGGWSDYFTQKAQNISIFTRNEYALTEKTNIIFGLRYMRDIKDFSSEYHTNGANGCKAIEDAFGLNPTANAPSSLAGVVGTVCVPWARSALDGINHVQKFDDDNVAGNITLSHELNAKTRIYANYSRGVKAGGFNLDRVMVDNLGTIVSGAVGNQTIRTPNTSFAPEKVDAFEIGLKGQNFNNNLNWAFAAFKQDFTNFQLNTYNGISQIVAQVPEVNSKGGEFDFNYKTNFGIKFGGAIAYNDTVYGANLGASNNSASFLGQNLNLYLIAGQQLTASPRLTTSNWVQYSFTSKNYNYDFNINNRHTSSFNGGSNLDLRKNVEAMNLTNAAFEIARKNSNWSVNIFAKNIGDKHYAQIIFDGPLQGNSPLMSASGTTRAITSQLDGFPALPRTYGISFKHRH
jgi:iron complex outermembrane recepter protein